MIKWLKRLILYPFITLIILIVVFFSLKRDLYHTIKGLYGSQLQWFGYEEKGNEIIEKSLKNIKSIDAGLLHAYSVQNTKNGNYDEAIRYLERAAELDPKDVDGYFGWVLLYYYRDYEKSLFYLNRLDNSTNYTDYVGDDNILYAKGLCFKQLKQYDKALALFEEAIDNEIEQHNIEWVTYQMYFQTGRTLHLMNRQKEAIEYYNKAIEDWSGSSESIFYKGLAEIDLGIPSGCDNLNLALEKLLKGKKSIDSYVKLFDEIYAIQVEEMITLKCEI